MTVYIRRVRRLEDEEENKKKIKEGIAEDINIKR